MTFYHRDKDQISVNIDDIIHFRVAIVILKHYVAYLSTGCQNSLMTFYERDKDQISLNIYNIIHLGLP